MCTIVQVYGHRSCDTVTNSWEVEGQRAKARSLADRWRELSRKLELQVSQDTVFTSIFVVIIIIIIIIVNIIIIIKS